MSTIEWSYFSQNEVGVITENYALPTIKNNSFVNNAIKAVENLSTSTPYIDATNNYWGYNSGPYDPTDAVSGPPDYNPWGNGDPVSDYVEYRPWIKKDQNSEDLVASVMRLNEALFHYLNYNAAMAHDANWKAYQELYKSENADPKEYWIELLSSIIPDASQEVNVAILEKLTATKFATPNGFKVFLEGVLFEIQRLNTNMLLDEMLIKAMTEQPLSLDYFHQNVVIDGSNMTVDDAVASLTMPYIPDILPPEFPLDEMIERIDNISTDLEAVIFCCPASVNGKYERSGLWYIPGSCDLSQVKNYTVGTDIQQAMRYYFALEDMLSSKKWDAVHQTMCGETATALAYSAKTVSFFIGVPLLLTPAGLGILGGSEAIYTAYGGGCSLLGYQTISVKYNKVTKLAHSLLKFNSSWPDALYEAVLLRAKVIDDLEDLIENPPTNECSQQLSIASLNVPDKICADFLNQFAEVNMSINVQNNNGSLDGKAKLFTELYAVGYENRLNHIRTDSTETVTILPGGSYQFLISERIYANGLLYENDRYKVIFKVVTSGELLSASRTFQCLYDWQCNIQDFYDDSRDVINGLIREGTDITNNFTSSVGARLNEFTLSWPGSDLNLHIYDASGNHVGYDSLTETDVIEIPGAYYSGSGTYPEIISLPNPVDSYTIIIEGVSVVDSEYYSLEVYEELDHVAVLLPLVPSLNLVGNIGDSIDFEIGFHEDGGYNNTTSITASISPLVSLTDDTLTNVNLTVLFTEIPADSADYASGFIKTDSTDAGGNYYGTIDVSFNGGAFQLPVVLSLNSPGCCIDFTGNVNCSESEDPDISDITRLIDYLYLSHAPLCCLEEADANGSGGDPDISDITRLIDYLYLSHTPLALCP